MGFGSGRCPSTSPEELDHDWLWFDPECPGCGGKLRQPEEPGRTLQQLEWSGLPVQIEQHTAQAQWCLTCRKSFVPAFPEELRKAGLVGPRLTALVGFLKGACHMSYSTIQQLWTWCFRAYLDTVYKISPSRGSGVLIEVLGKEFDGVLGCDCA